MSICRFSSTISLYIIFLAYVSPLLLSHSHSQSCVFVLAQFFNLPCLLHFIIVCIKLKMIFQSLKKGLSLPLFQSLSHLFPFSLFMTSNNTCMLLYPMIMSIIHYYLYALSFYPISQRAHQGGILALIYTCTLLCSIFPHLISKSSSCIGSDSC